jgi:type I restriction enzyme S subunit
VSHALPEGWELRQLDQIADVRLGRQRSPKNHMGTHMRPYLRAANVGWSGLLLNDVKEMNFTEDEMSIYRLEPDDIVLGEASGSPDEVGKPAMWGGQIADCAFQNTLLRVRSHTAEPKYLLYYFRHLALSQAFARRSRGVGIHHIGRAALASWLVPLPPVVEQRRIVEILEDHLSRLDSALESLEQARRRLAAMTTVGLESDTRIRAAPRRPLGEILAEPLSNGRSVRDATHGFPVLRLTALRNGRVDLSQRKVGAWSAEEAARFLVQAGDFFVARGNGSLNLVGRGGLVIDEPDGVAYPDTLIRVRSASDSIDPAYLAIVWEMHETRQQIEGRARTTAGIYKINQRDLEGLMLPVPTLAEQVAVVETTNARRSKISHMSVAVGSAHVRAGGLRRALLESAFTGMLV